MQVLRARWILPVEAPPIRDGMLGMHEGRITFVGPAPAGDSAAPWLEAAIVPALVNVHTHLEFSELAQPIGEPAMAFPDWIHRVMAWRQSRDSDEAIGSSQRCAAIRAGIAESLAGHAAAVGEIATSDGSQDELSQRATELRSVAFLELIGLSAERIAPLLDRAREYLARVSAGGVVRGLSPHAPYTVHPELLAKVASWSAHGRFPLAMHLAESRDELQLLRDGSGPLRELLDDLRVWSPQAIPFGARPLDYLHRLAAAWRSLVVHGNYLDVDERKFLAEHRATLTLAYCPRTHAFFGHEPYPLAELVEQNVRVALGTDSRASNPNLNMLEELRFAAARHPAVAPAELLRMATLHGAHALGLENELGSLRPGKLARFAIHPLAADQRLEPYAWMQC